MSAIRRDGIDGGFAAGTVTAAHFIGDGSGLTGISGTGGALRGLAAQIRKLTSAATLTTNDTTVICDTSSGSFKVTLFAAATGVTNMLWIQNTGVNTVIVTNANGTDTINGLLAFTNSIQNQTLQIVSDGAGHWQQLNPQPTPTTQSVTDAFIGTLHLTNAAAADIGGTGRSSLTSSNLIVGNGTGPVVFLPIGSDFITTGGVLAMNRINVQTNSVDNTATPVWTNTFVTNSILMASVRIIGKGHTNDIIGTWNIQIERDASGPFMVASNWSGITNATYAMTNVYVTISGNNAVLNFIGTNGEDMNWSFIGDFNYMAKGINPPSIACSVFIDNSGVGAPDTVAATPTAVGYVQQAFFADGNGICSALINFGPHGGDHSYTLEVWGGTNRTGLQYGTASISGSPVSSDDIQSYTFTWDSQAHEPAPPSGGYYFLTIVTDAPSSSYSIASGPASLSDQGDSYPAFIGGTPQSDSLNIFLSTRH